MPPTQHCLPYECLRADSEDSGLGPSPAKSIPGPGSPGGSVSPIQFDDRSDSLLDLSPRTENSDDSEEGKGGFCSPDESGDRPFRHCCLPPDDRPSDLPQSGPFQFLLSSADACDAVRTRRDSSERSDFRLIGSSPLVGGQTTVAQKSERSFFDKRDSCHAEDVDGPRTAESRSSSRDDDDRRNFVHNGRHMTPKVVLVRTDFRDVALFKDAEDAKSRSSDVCPSELNGDCPSSNCSQAGGSGGSTSDENGDCKWLHCSRSADDNTTATDLVEHIRQCHVQSQPEDEKSFVCLWVGCKVYDRPSCSRSWLERHVLLHGGSKPFRCIVDGCLQRFGTELVLERHVNSHFLQNSRGRLLRRKRQSRNRKRPQSHKSKDFFDEATMEHVRHNLFQLSSIEGMNSGGPPSAITFHSSVVGRRIDCTGKVNILLRWSPEDILPDSWIAEKDFVANHQKTIPFSQLPRQALQSPSLVALDKTGVMARPGKRKRK